MPDEEDRAEALDESKLGEEYPPEDPLGVDQYGTTPAEERVDEPIEERVEREQPEPSTVRTPTEPPVGDLVAEEPDDGDQVAEQVDVPVPDPERAADDLEGAGSRSAEQDAVRVDRPAR